MGELYDFTNDYPGHYQIFNPDPGGIAILDDDQSILNVDPELGDELHPRNQGIDRRTTFSSGAGRKEGFEARENFGSPNFSRDRQQYLTGKWPPSENGVKSNRRGWVQIEDVNWDPRPPHYNPNSPNEYAHLYVSPSMRGNPSQYPDANRMVYEGFGNRGDFDSMRVVLFFILVIIITMLGSFTIGFNVGRASETRFVSHPAAVSQ